MCVCVFIPLFYLALLALSSDLSQALECECEKHALVVSLSSASQRDVHDKHAPAHTHHTLLNILLKWSA